MPDKAQEGVRAQQGEGLILQLVYWVHHASLAWGRAQAAQLLSINQSWHFEARQRRWHPALEVGVWPLSQHCLPSPGPLTSVGQGTQQAHCRPASLPQWSHSEALKQAPLEGTSSSSSSMPLAKAFSCVGVGSGAGDSCWQPVQHY